jgi:hypothetical protein
LLFLSLALSTCISSTLWAQDSSALVRTVVAGKHCYIGTNFPSGTPRVDCEFRVGKSLHFVIVAVGQADVVVKVFKADFDGDYYLSLGGLHKCVTINPGEKSVGLNMGFAHAFVSPRTGKVFDDWHACDDA